MNRDVIENWWSSSENNFPSELLKDRRILEELRFSLLLSENSENFDEKLIERLRRAATLLEIGAFENNVSYERWQLIALIYEALGIIEPVSIDTQWLISSLAWQIGHAPAIAGQLSNYLASRQTFYNRDLFEQIIISFGTRDFRFLEQLSREAISQGNSIRKKAKENQEVLQGLEAGLFLSIGQLIDDLSKYILFQSDNLPETQYLDDFVKFSKNLNDSYQFRIGRLFHKCVSSFIQSSSRFSVESVKSLPQNTKSIIQNYLSQYPELWDSQKLAIDKGLLDSSRKNFVVAIPTSSGKTLCGELAIIQEITEKPYATCFYVVPTRALVEEKGVELKRKFKDKLYGVKVATATGALQNDEIESFLLLGSQVIICTPEKLDLLIRHEDELLNNASLFIVDEGHLIDDKGRGLGLEFVVIKLMLLKPDARILMLSAMIPNSEDFGRWLASESSVCSTSWRPTRQKFGEIRFEAIKPRGSELKLELYDENSLLDDIEFTLKRFPKQPKSIAEKVVWSSQVLRKRGPVLVFCMAKARCEKIAESIVDYLKTDEKPDPSNILYKEIHPRVNALRNKIVREVSHNFLLNDALAFGIAYHHADLPPRIRIDLEHLISDGLIDVVISTTTLAEGVNLPISTVIYEDWETNPDRRTGIKPEPLDLSKFRNIAGRAGRAGKESEGLILFLEPSRKPIADNGEKLTPREFFLRDEYPPIKSRFLDIVEKYKVPQVEWLKSIWAYGDGNFSSSDYKYTLRQFGLSVLHTLEVLKDLDEENLAQKVVDLSLLAIQKPDKTPKAKLWFQSWVNFYKEVKLEREELRPLAMQVGLPLRAIQRLYAKIIESTVSQIFTAQTENSLLLSDEQTQIIANLIAGIEELDLTPLAAPHETLLAEWIKGANIDVLVDIYSPFLEKSPKAKVPSRAVEKTCNYVIKQLSNSGAWGAYAITRILQLIVGDELLPISNRLALFTYYGVNSVPAVLLSLLGIERIDSLRLGNRYIEEGNTTASILDLKLWARSKSTEEVRKILIGNDNRELDNETLNVLNTD